MPRIAFALPVAILLATAFPAGAQESQTLKLPTGREYKLLSPKPADQLRGAPLVVYLHPSGGAMLDEFSRDWWPGLKARGCVVAVPQAGDQYMWTVKDPNYIGDVIADVQKRLATDPDRLILLGISGGGQTALFLADRAPKMFSAVVAISTNPVVARGGEQVWFYPDRSVLKTCPYFILAHITQGATLQYWRQVRQRSEPLGASISIVPVLGEPGHYLTPPKEFAGWLDTVLAGKQPSPLPDPQGQAVAKTFAPLAEKWMKLLEKAEPNAVSEKLTKQAKPFTLTVPLQKDFERSKREDQADANGLPLVQIRTEHVRWPIYVRVDARQTAEPMGKTLAAEAEQTRLRGLLYQVYQKGTVADRDHRDWQVSVGSITFPDKRRGWRTTLFLHAATPLSADGKRFCELTIMDETQEPDPAQLAEAFQTLVRGIEVKVE